MRRIISAVLTFIAATKYDTLFDMLYDDLFEMIDDCLFESVAVSIGEENRNGDENTVEVAERQGIFRA